MFATGPKIYRIEYSGSSISDYSTTLEKAREHLMRNGFRQTQEFDEKSNLADMWELDAGLLFEGAKAKIVSINTIG